MDKTGKQLRCSFQDSRTPGMTFIAQPESDTFKLLDERNYTETSDDESEDDLKYTKERLASLSNDYSDDDEFELNKSEANKTNMATERSFDGNNINWQQMDSFHGMKPNEYSGNYRGVNEGSVSLDAVSLNEHRNTQFQRIPTENDRSGEFIKHHSVPHVCGNNLAKANFFDSVVVYAENDIREVIDFVEIVKGLVHYAFQYEPVIEYYDQGKFCSSNVSIAEDVLNKASVVFMYLTRNINTEYFDLFVDEAVFLSRLGLNPNHVMAGRRTTDRQWSLKPVHTLPMNVRDYKTPAGLVSIRGIDWFHKDSEHTRNTIICIMREARRIREEAERNAVGNQLLAYSQMQSGFPSPSVPNSEKLLAARGLASNQPQAPTYTYPVSPGIVNSGEVTIKFRPSARSQPPVVMHRSPGSPYSQPLSSYHANQPMYGVQQRHQFVDPRMVQQNPAGRTFQSSGQSVTAPPHILRPDLHVPQQHALPLRQSNVQAPVPEPQPIANVHTGSQQAVDSHRRNNESLRREESRIHRVRQKYRNNVDSSDSESSSSDDFEGSLPPKLKRKRNINIIGCRYVQLGKNNQVLDGPALPTKKNKASKSKQVKQAREEASSLSSEAKPPFEHKVSVKEHEDNAAAAQLQMVVEEPQRVPPVRTSIQGFHSSVTEDNLDLSTSAQFYVNTNFGSSPSLKSSNQKDLTLDQFSGTGRTKSHHETIKFDKTERVRNKDNFESVSDKVSNVTLKSEEELQEYQLTVKAKHKEVFINDLDKSESDDENCLGDSVTGHNIRFDSSGDDNNILSEDPDTFEDGPLTKTSMGQESERQRSMAEKPFGGLHNRSSLQSLVPSRQTSISFMDMMKSLHCQVRPVQSNVASSTPRKPTNEDADDVD